MMPLFSVLLVREQPTPAIAKVIAAHRRIPVQDAARWSKNCWGILGSSLAEAEANALREEAERCGLEARVVPDERMVAPPELRPASLCSLHENGFDLSLPNGKQGTVAFGDVGLFAVYAWKQITQSSETVTQGPSATAKLVRTGLLLTTGIPLPKGKSTTMQQVTEHSSLLFFLDLVLKQPLVRVRIDAQRQDYGLLKERMLHGTAANFRVLAERLAERIPCLRNRGAELFLAGKPVQQMGYETPADAEKELRWMLTNLNEERR